MNGNAVRAKWVSTMSAAGHLVAPSGTNSGQTAKDRATSRNHDLPGRILPGRILLPHRDRSDGHSDFVQGPDQVCEIPVEAAPTKCRRLQTHFEKPELARWTFIIFFQVHHAPGARHDANPVGNAVDSLPGMS